MKNLKFAPAVVIGFAYLVTTIPSAIYSIVTGEFILGIQGITGIASRPSFDLGIFYYAMSFSKLAPVITIVIFILILIAALIFRFRKVWSLSAYYISMLIFGFFTFISYIYNLVITIGEILNPTLQNVPTLGDNFTQTMPPYYDSLIAVTPSTQNVLVSLINSPQVVSTINLLLNILFWLVILYFLDFYRKSTKAIIVEEKSVSITEVLKK